MTFFINDGKLIHRIVVVCMQNCAHHRLKPGVKNEICVKLKFVECKFIY